MDTGNEIYSRFEVTKRDGTKVKLRIQQLRKQDQTKLIDLLKLWYLPEETFARCSGILKSDEALKEYTGFLSVLLSEEDTPTLVCYVDDEREEPEIVAFNIYFISKKEEEPDMNMETPEVKQFFNIITVLENVYDLHEDQNVDKYLGGAGLGVNPSYRGCGIATELLKARKALIKKLGIPVTGVWLTSVGSQKAAARAGYQVMAEIDYQELGQRSGVTFTDVPKTCVYGILWP